MKEQDNKLPKIILGETVRKLKTGQTKLQNIATNNINNNKMMWSENLKKEFSDSLGGVKTDLKAG